VFNFYDLLAGTQQRAAFEDLGRRFGIGPEETRAAVAALMPALAEAMRRTMPTPDAWAAYLRAFNPALFGTPASHPGQDAYAALSAMLGSPDAARKVTEQAAAASGVSGEILRQMLPPLAATMMGAMMKAFGTGLSGASAEPKRGTPADPLGAMMEAMLKGFGGTAAAPPPQAEARPQATGLDSFLEAGREIGEQQRRSMEAFFDAFLKPPKG
jgi:hypothetical protein